MSHPTHPPREQAKLLTLPKAGMSRSIPAFFPPEPIDKLIRYLTNRFKKPATMRVGPQAMIVTSVRIQSLIALLSRQSFDTPHGPVSSRYFELGPVRFGFFEDEPDDLKHGMGRWRGSARKRPQSCGKNPAIAFDVEGLISWLRDKYPRSTIHHVEAETGISAASVENWLHRRSQPSVEHFMILLTSFGPALLQACLHDRPDWVEVAAIEERKREIDEQIARLTSERKAFIGRENRAS